MKTILEWFQEAKEQGYEWADAAIANCGDRAMNEKVELLSEALYGAFLWFRSPQGHNFWSEIASKLERRHK